MIDTIRIRPLTIMELESKTYISTKLINAQSLFLPRIKIKALTITKTEVKNANG